MTASTLRSETADLLWRNYARTGDPRVRESIIHQFEPLARSLAHRFARRGADSEDLVQVALVGLVKAVDRFDPSTNYRFSTLATPIILGELRHYFRDHGWRVHVPRGMQERSFHVGRARRELTEQLGREPSAAEVGQRLSLTEEEVLHALTIDELNHPLSLDAVMTGADPDQAMTLEQCVGGEDAGLHATEERVGMLQAVAQLREPLRTVITLRYLEGKSQREVAAQMGISQMQVCRIERRALGELRSQLVVH